MPVHKIQKYPLTHFGGVQKLKVPEGSTVVGVVAMESEPSGVIQVLVIEPIPQEGEKVVEEEVKLVALSDTKPIADPSDDEFLSYIGSVSWSNGYRLTHLFQIMEEDVWDGVEDDFEGAGESEDPNFGKGDESPQPSEKEGE